MNTIFDTPILPTIDIPNDDHEIVTVECQRCTTDTCHWESTRSNVPTSVEQHVDAHHIPWNGVGPARPNGSPVWVEGEDWWIEGEG